eukprot:COSAG05_NODE_156_length_15696_cov_359.955440_3_plen_67_part_00
MYESWHGGGASILVGARGMFSSVIARNLYWNTKPSKSKYPASFQPTRYVVPLIIILETSAKAPKLT